MKKKFARGRNNENKKFSLMSYVHKNFVHLHQSILKENIGLTMQLLIFESKASREKNSSVQPKIFQIFLFLFFQKANQIITLLIFIKKFFFNFIKSFFWKLKYDDNTISAPCDRSLKKYLRNLALQVNIQLMPNNIMKRKWL